MVLTKIEVETMRYSYTTYSELIVDYEYPNLNFESKNKKYTCTLNYLPEELRNEFKQWVEKANKYISDKIETKEEK